MSCTGWRLGISPVIWASIRDQRERPRSGTDCTSRKCNLPGGVVRRYTICKAPPLERRTEWDPHARTVKYVRVRPRLRIYDNDRMIGSMTVPSFEWGQQHVDRLIGSGSLTGLSRRRAR